MEKRGCRVAVLLVMCGEFEDFGTADCQSAVNCTTLGYGDMVMSAFWRLLGPLKQRTEFFWPVLRPPWSSRLCSARTRLGSRNFETKCANEQGRVRGNPTRYLFGAASTRQ